MARESMAQYLVALLTSDGDNEDSVRAALPGHHGQGVGMEGSASMEQFPFLAAHFPAWKLLTPLPGIPPVHE